MYTAVMSGVGFPQAVAMVSQAPVLPAVNAGIDFFTSGAQAGQLTGGSYATYDFSESGLENASRIFSSTIADGGFSHVALSAEYSSGVTHAAEMENPSLLSSPGAVIAFAATAGAIVSAVALVLARKQIFSFLSMVFDALPKKEIDVERVKQRVEEGKDPAGTRLTRPKGVGAPSGFSEPPPPNHPRGGGVGRGVKF